MSDHIYFHEVEVLTYPLFEYPPYDLVLATKMAEVMTRFDLDILHVHYAIPHSISAYLAKMMLTDRVVPFVTTLHGTDITLVGNDRSYLPITRFGIEQSDAVTAVSEYLRQSHDRRISNQRADEVVPNFVDCDVYGRSTDRATSAGSLPSHDEGILIHISNFRPVKRIEDVIEIFALVRKKTKAQAADGRRWSRTSEGRVAGEYTWCGRDVIFVGKQNDMSQLLSISDVLLLPSELESSVWWRWKQWPARFRLLRPVWVVFRKSCGTARTDFSMKLAMSERWPTACLQILQDPHLRANMGSRPRACHRDSPPARSFYSTKISTAAPSTSSNVATYSDPKVTNSGCRYKAGLEEQRFHQMAGTDRQTLQKLQILTWSNDVAETSDWKLNSRLSWQAWERPARGAKRW